MLLSCYSLDFGNIVLNSNPKKRVFKLSNSGDLNLDVVFDSKAFKAAGYTITPERVTKLMKGQTVTMLVTYSSKKSKVSMGKNRTLVPMEVKNGPKYQLELVHNLTFPEISIETEQLDFGRVLVNQRKTVFLRFSNDKEVDCNWEIKKQGLNPSEKKDESRFQLLPQSGCIQPGQRTTVQLSFMPSQDKTYQYKFMVSIADNAKSLMIYVRGQGAQVALEYSPEIIKIGPVLPYDDCAYALLEVRNPSDYDTELFSLDFDRQFCQEEKELL